ncbi:4-coumarate--CoA ligase 1-like [Drosophila busckii]|uniref:4-coumarate--CoA ligase 1-like n=1 Tax=Drosophila busckii TaxID=30019 RepID=UPI00083EB3B9|nr:4-coumarate--CoA ligase 1-like [Drosophila busckii]
MEQYLQTTYNKRQGIWSGVKLSPMYDFDCSVGRIIHKALGTYPTNVAQICLIDGKTTTNAEILAWSVRLAQHFKQRCLRHDDVICIAAKTSTYITPTAVACLFNATPFHAVNPTLELTTLTHVLAITKPKLIFCDAAQYEKLKTASAAWSPEFITILGKVEGVAHVEDLLTATKTEMFYQPVPLCLGGNQTMAILCSSGTSGQPKAVCRPNHQLIINSNFIGSDMVIYCNSGLDWNSGLIAFLYSVTNGCTRIIPDKPFSATYFVELVDKYKINFVMCGTRHVNELIASPEATRQRLASIMLLAIGGSWIAADSLRQLQQLLSGQIFYAYGSTEFPLTSGGFYKEHLGNSVGQLLPGRSVRIVDDNGKSLGCGEVGELLVHYIHSWSGYYGNALETQRTQDAQGWFHSGDLGYFDADHNLYIVDRKKEIYKCLGMQYSPNELESLIAELPAVQEVCVVGIYDERLGDAPAALIVKCPGSFLSEQLVKQHVEKRCSVAYKQLHGGVYFATQLPLNANGKVLRRAVKLQLQQSLPDR